jgi:hypothetical protein
VTEGAPAPLATWQDVQSRWRPLGAAEQAVATARIGDASALLRLAFRDIDSRIASDPNLAVVATGLVSDAVIRVLSNPERAKQRQETIGPRSYGLTFESGPTGIFFTEDELRRLVPPPAKKGTASLGIGTAFVSVRPGWAGPGHRRRPW